jgi:hypothetical protein
MYVAVTAVQYASSPFLDSEHWSSVPVQARRGCAQRCQHPKFRNTPQTPKVSTNYTVKRSVPDPDP